MPTKTSYAKGANLNLSGMVVKATYTDGTTSTITGYTTSPANGATLSTTGTTTVTVSYTESGITKTTSFSVNVIAVASWSSSTDAEIAATVAALDAGTITADDTGWKVGDTRNVSLAAFTTYKYKDNIGVLSETQAAQTAQLVIMNVGGKTFRGNGTSLDGTSCHFVVGFKDNVCESVWNEPEYNNTYSGSKLKTVENNVYNALPTVIKPIFKKFDVVTGIFNSGSRTETTQQYFTSPSEQEVFGTNTYAYMNEGNQFTWLTNHHIYCWERSPARIDDGSACYSSGSYASYNSIYVNLYVMPYGCI